MREACQQVERGRLPAPFFRTEQRQNRGDRSRIDAVREQSPQRNHVIAVTRQDEKALRDCPQRVKQFSTVDLGRPRLIVLHGGRPIGRRRSCLAGALDLLVKGGEAAVQELRRSLALLVVFDLRKCSETLGTTSATSGFENLPFVASSFARISRSKRTQKSRRTVIAGGCRLRDSSERLVGRRAFLRPLSSRLGRPLPALGGARQR